MMHDGVMYISLILMHACIYDAANFVPDERTDQPTNKAILGVGFNILAVVGGVGLLALL